MNIQSISAFAFYCDEITPLWWNEQINIRLCYIFLILGSNVPTFVKEVFYISYGLVCDKMTQLWRNEPINTKYSHLFVKLTSNVKTFVKEVFYISYGLGCDERNKFVPKLTD